ncbi:MAG: 3-oxoacyl-[acyl-carrier-protein] synthase III C-terminal domain-containing protein [Bacteriovoracia bacterium]
MILSHFSVHLPPYSASQGELLDWVARLHTRADEVRATPERSPRGPAEMERLVRRYGCSPEKIGRRYSYINEFLNTDFSVNEVYRIGSNQASGVDTRARTEIYGRIADRVFGELYPVGESAPNHLIHVTCTGYLSPSAAQKLVGTHGWHGRTDVTHAYHMGCYGALPAIRMAEGFLASRAVPQGGHVDIVHTEVCSLQMDPADHSPEQLIVQSLFADGSIRYRLSERPAAGLQVLAVGEYLVPGSSGSMTWITGAHGMRMTLAREVPFQIAEYLKPCLENLRARAGLGASREPMLYAIHPGGPKIIENLASFLSLSPDQVHHSQEILRTRGNLSSATLPHVWELLVRDAAVPTGTPILSLAFGPGLTIFGAVLRKI